MPKMGIKKKTGDTLHVSWRVVYEPGPVKVVTRKNNTTVLEKTIHTAGAPARIIATADRSKIHADGSDLSFITVKIVDKAGNLVPDAANLVQFDVKGNGFIAGVDNGSPVSMESFKANNRKAFNGMCLAVIQSNGRPGIVSVTASATGLAPVTLQVTAK